MSTAAEQSRPDASVTGASSRRKGVTVDRIVDTAIDILSDRGEEALTTAEIARRLSISQPTLYSHIVSLDQIRELVAIRGVGELSERVREAVRGLVGDEALRAMAQAYRKFVRAAPALYMLQMKAPPTPAFSAAGERAKQAVRDVLRARGLSEDQVLYVHSVVRASIHGFVDLEVKNALGDIDDADKSFSTYLRILAKGIDGLAAEAAQ